MEKNTKTSFQSSLLLFVILVVLTATTILVETYFNFSVSGHLIIKAGYLGLIYLLNSSLGGKLSQQLFSMGLMSVLVFFFFLSVAIATGVETYYDTNTAQKVIYKSQWFEWIIFILFINLIANITRYSLLKKDKIGSFIFHVSFLIIVIGAFVTRNFGFEGFVSIPEGQEKSHILSRDTYLQTKIDDGNQQYVYDMPLLISEHTSNYFQNKVDFPNVTEPISIEFKDFLPGYFTQDTINYVEKNGNTFLHIVTVGQNGRKNNYLKDGTILLDGGLKISYNNSTESDAIKLIKLDSGLYVMSPYDLTFLQMSDQSEGVIKRDSLQPFLPMRLYMLGGIQFVFKQTFENAQLRTIETTYSPLGKDNLVVTVKQGNETKDVYLPGGSGIYSDVQEFEFGGLNYRMSFGSKIIELPFSILLRDFQLEKYPGTERPSSYASEVTVIEGDKKLNHRIYMNNVLDYGGYRFFQSSYSITPQQESTVLSVNHDWWGTQITYLGYTLMAFGFFISIFLKKSRFMFLSKKSHETRLKREKMLALLFIFGLTTSFTSLAQTETDNYIPVNKIHAEKFGHLVIQSQSGRFAPIHTTAKNLLRKVSRQDSYNGLTPMQVFVGLHSDFQYWFTQPLIYVSGDSTNVVLGTEGQKRVSMKDFYDEKGAYKLDHNMSVALSKSPAKRSVFEKNFVKTDERFNIIMGVSMGYYLKIFPIQDKWYAPADVIGNLTGEDSMFVNGMMSMYIFSLRDAKESGNWSEADKMVSLIDTYQQKQGAEFGIPSKEKIEWEITYNKLDIFKHLSNLYLVVGLFLLIVQFRQIFKPKKSVKWAMIIGIAIFAVLFVIHGLGLGLRWYLSGHAPWSNGYEAIIFIAFIVGLVGLLFSKHNKIVVGATGIFAWLLLFVAHLSNMDPQMSNLEPVLKSYWLKVHVAIITGSYAFLGLPALLGIINMSIDIVKTKANYKHLNLVAKELRYVSEMVMTIGLFMLTIGTFLGGVWANESWGRYWGWDAKETWALASVLVYTIILHFRFVPGLKSDFTFNFWSLWGYSTIIMTFYGVNYYLAGLHSYATGDPVPIPYWVPLTVTIFGVLSLVAWLRKKQFNSKK